MFTRFLMLSVVAISLTGCGIWHKTVADTTGWTTVCVNGVSYLQFPHGVTPERTITNALVPCS